MLRVFQLGGCGTAMIAFLGCQAHHPPSAASPIETQVPPVSTPTRMASDFDADVLQAVSAFKSWPKLTRTPRTAPAMCIFYPENWTTSHISESGDEATHGEKVYHLYAMDSKAYQTQTRMFAWEPGKGDPVAFEGIEQVLIKDAFRPVAKGDYGEVLHAAGNDGKSRSEVGIDWKNTAYRDYSKIFVEGEAMGQYLMIKYAADRPGTDQGWVYATVRPSGEIIQAGMIESCMGCHTRAPFGRMFGLGKDAP